MRAIYDELSQQVDEPMQFPGLRVSSRITRPVLVGVFRSFILIPPAYDERGFDKESLKIIMLHELAHAAQGDTYFSAAASVAQSLWFFLPFLWWLRAQLRIDQEFLADQNVVMLTGSPAGYATRLVTLATPQKGTDSNGTAAAASLFRSERWGYSGVHSPLLQRVLMLLHCPYPLEPRSPRWWALSAPLLVVGLAILSVWISLSLVDRPSLSAGASSVADAPASFRIAQFIAPPQKTNSHGRSPYYTLPVLLPPEFVLDVEIQASRAALSRIRLVGLALDSPRPTNGAADVHLESSTSVAPWHQIRVRRHAGQVTLNCGRKSDSSRPRSRSPFPMAHDRTSCRRDCHPPEPPVNLVKPRSFSELPFWQVKLGPRDSLSF